MIDHFICYAVAFTFLVGAALLYVTEGDRWAFVALIAGTVALLLGGCSLYTEGDTWEIDLPLALVDGPCAGAELPPGGLSIQLTIENPTTAPTMEDPAWTCSYTAPYVFCERDDLPYRTTLTVREDQVVFTAGTCSYVFEGS